MQRGLQLVQDGSARASGDASIVAVERFIHATRDSGYKGTSSAVAELVDNALQAGATRIHIAIGREADDSLTLSVLDNGRGMDAATLRQALRFGGSSRFDDREGLGRYGMGLPNSSLSQARHVDVFTWQERGRVLTSYLDVDEIGSGAMAQVPQPRRAHLPPACPEPPAAAGTLVVWSRCDRLDHRRASTIARKLTHFIGRVFRHYLWRNVSILVDGEPVRGIDPLFLHAKSPVRGGELFGEPIEYTVEAPAGASAPTGTITVTFSELPVEKWHERANEEKRKLGITKGAGVSIVRAGREIDYGWFFMGDKRKENYDDWWRCEVRFEPVLDELFGITHTKQQIRPREQLHEILGDDLASTAKQLNARVRRAHLRIKARANYAESEKVASARDHLLPPLPKRPPPSTLAGLEKILAKLPPPPKQSAGVAESGASYSIVESEIPDAAFFHSFRHQNRLVLVLNPVHPFYKKVYRPLSEHDHELAKSLRGQLELILLAAARAEALASKGRNQREIAKQRLAWSNAIASFLSG
ncbi:MAG TPA: ATP-binding protein [Polyangiaceae bacterium]|jgi:hypothetical protein